MIRVVCPRCSTGYDLEDALAGGEFNCSICHERLRIVSPALGPAPASMSGVPLDVNAQKITSGCLAIGLGFAGVHKFYLGRMWSGLQTIGASLLAAIVFFPLFFAVWAVAATEGIIYLTRSDGEFHSRYVAGNREWL